MTGKISRRDFVIGTGAIAALAGCYSNLDGQQLAAAGGAGSDVLSIPSGETVTIGQTQIETVSAIDWANNGVLELEEGAVLEFTAE